MRGVIRFKHSAFSFYKTRGLVCYRRRCRTGIASLRYLRRKLMIARAARYSFAIKYCDIAWYITILQHDLKTPCRPPGRRSSTEQSQSARSVELNTMLEYTESAQTDNYGKRMPLNHYCSSGDKYCSTRCRTLFFLFFFWNCKCWTALNILW